MIGYIVLHHRKNGYEIGYSFHPSYQKKGYARESISKVLKEMREKGADKWNHSIFRKGKMYEY